LNHIIQRENRTTIGLIHGLNDSKDLSSNSHLSLAVNPMHHIHLLFGLPGLLLSLVNLSVMHWVLLIVHIVIRVLDLLVHNVHRSDFLVMKGPVFLRQDLEAHLVTTQTSILVFETQNKQVIRETVNLHSGFVGILTGDIESALEEFAFSDSQDHFLETKVIFIERSAFRQI
jgi:hypothetical protein